MLAPASRLVALALVLLAVACGTNAPTDPDPLDPTDPTGPTEPAADSARVAATVAPPAGAPFAVDDLRVMAGLDIADVDASGEAQIAHEDGSTHVAWVLDADDNVVMAGFIDDDGQTIDAESTAMVLAFIGMQGHLRQFEVQERIRDALSSSPELGALTAEVETAISADATAVQDGALTDAVRDWVEARFDEVAVAGPDIAQIVADPAVGRNGFQIDEADLEHFTITNNKRRRARAFVYPLRVTKEGGQEVVIDTEIRGSDTPISETKVNATTAIRGFTGVLVDWARGSGADFAAVTTGPIAAPMAADEIEAVHAVRIISPTDPVPLDWLTETEEAALYDLYVETFAIDWVLPLLLDLAGHAELFDGVGTIASPALATFASNFGPILGSVPAAEAKVAQGDLSGAFEDFAFAVWNEAGAGLLTNLFDNLLVPMLNATLQSERAAVTTVPRGALRVMEVTDVVMKAIDYGRLAYAVSGPSLTEFEVTSTRRDVLLVPEHVESVPFVMKPFRAFPRNTVPDGATLAYHWTLSSGVGRLVDNRGRAGASLDTSDDNVQLDPNFLVSGRTEGTLIVDVTYSLPGGDPVALGSDTSTVAILPNEQEIRPRRPRLQCRTNVRLHVRRTDGVVNVTENPTYDWRVDWSTAGAYGEFVDGSTQTSRFNRPDMTYACTDTEVEDAEEIVRARVYRSDKGENDWTFVSEAVDTLEIDNDPNIRILHRPLSVQLIEILPDDPDYARWSAMLLATITPPMGPPSALSYSVRSYGFDGDAPNYVVVSDNWNAGEVSARPVHASLRGPDHLTDGSYLYMVTASGCEGARELGGCTAGTLANAVALFQSWGGWVEIEIQLEDTP